MAGPRYSVLLPTHNRADVVGLAIASVLGQTEADFELLVVGDGCTDATAEVVTSFADSRVRWFDLPKAPGFGYANRNVCLREATGELMAFMAHDDLMLPDHLENMAAAFEDARVEWAYSRPLWVADDGTIVPFPVDLRQSDQLAVFLSHHNSIPASCVVYRRSVHDRVGAWSEDVAVAADWELWKRIIGSDAGSGRGTGSSRGAGIGYVRKPTILHFRADWRKASAWGPPPLPAWLEAAHRPWWPAALRVAIDDRGPQRTLAGLIDADWVERMRSAVDDAVDGLAWRQSAELHRLRRWLRPRQALLRRLSR